MNCPRCFLPMRKETYEGVEIDFCDTCWGSWLDKGELPAIVKAEELEFDERDQKIALDLYSASKPGPRGPLLCPRCSTFMEQLRYDREVQLLIDRCPQHGVWLDAGEIKKIQILAEKSKAVRELLIRKLRLLES
jgi:Zn-finger nucleic acid-binding protein